MLVLLLFAATEGRIFVSHEAEIGVHVIVPAIIPYDKIEHPPGEFTGKEDGPESDEEYHTYRDSIEKEHNSMGNTDV